MTKVKQGMKTMDHSSTDHLKAVKSNPIQKKKNNKFANTPTGKVRLMNGKKVQNNNSDQKQLNKKQKGKKQVIKDSPDSPDSNSSLPKNNEKNNSPKQILSATKTLNSPNVQSGKNKKKLKKNFKNKTDKSNESLEDINEGIALAEDSIVSQDDDDNDIETEEEFNINLPNILGQSLADDTDEDDSDFEVEEDEESENDDSDKDGTSQLKGVKMFKGLLKQKLDSTEKDESDDDDDDDDDDDEEEDDEDDEDDDNEMDESMVVTDDSISPDTKKNKKIVSLAENEEEEEDSEDDEDEEDEEDEESSPGLKDLLGNSIMDDDDNDEDFEGEDEDDEDIDISDEESEIEVDKEEKEKRTIFISNIPIDTTRKEIKQVFKEFGSIESIRIRGVAPADSKISKKVAAITKQLHKNVDSVHMLVVFKNKQSVSKALSMNGKKFKNHILRVDGVGKDQAKPNAKNAVFLGNLPFSIKDNDVWKHFEECGEIDFIRLIRDKRTRMGKGVGYVNFKNEDSVALALELNGSTLADRQIRVKRCSEESSVSKKPRSNKNKRSRSVESSVKTSPKKLKVNDNMKTPSPVAGKKKLKAKRKLQENGSPSTETKKTTFQGQKATVGKKGKKSTLDKKKKKMAAILTSKPRKIQKV